MANMFLGERGRGGKKNKVVLHRKQDAHKTLQSNNVNVQIVKYITPYKRLTKRCLIIGRDTEGTKGLFLVDSNKNKVELLGVLTEDNVENKQKIMSAIDYITAQD